MNREEWNVRPNPGPRPEAHERVLEASPQALTVPKLPSYASASKTLSFLCLNRTEYVVNPKTYRCSAQTLKEALIDQCLNVCLSDEELTVLGEVYGSA